MTQGGRGWGYNNNEEGSDMTMTRKTPRRRGGYNDVEEGGAWNDNKERHAEEQEGGGYCNNSEEEELGTQRQGHGPSMLTPQIILLVIHDLYYNTVVSPYRAKRAQ